MDGIFTKEEVTLVYRMRSGGRWDNLSYDLTIMIPCYIIMALGLYNQSTASVVIGMCVYAILRLRVAYESGKSYPLMESIWSKVETHLMAGK